MVDEFADLATEQFVGFLSRARGSKLGVVIAHQELSDLDQAGLGFRDQVVTNTSTTISFLQKSAGSAEAIAGLAGTKTVTKATKQVEHKPLFIWEDKHYTGIESEREVEEFKIHPNVIKSLEQGHCVAIGKFPSSWHARVAVDPPVYPEVNLGEALAQLRSAKEALEKRTLGFTPLSLKERARAFADSNRRRSPSAPAPGLRTDTPSAVEETTGAGAESDDRF